MFSSWDLVRPRFWYPMSSLEQSMMELEQMSDAIMRPQGMHQEAAKTPSNVESGLDSDDDDDFFVDLPLVARKYKPTALQPEVGPDDEDEPSNFASDTDSSTNMEVDGEGKQQTPTQDKSKVSKTATKVQCKAKTNAKKHDNGKNKKNSKTNKQLRKHSYKVTPSTEIKEASSNDGDPRTYTSYLFSNSYVVDDKGRQVTTTRRRYEDSTGRLKAVHEREIGGKKLRTTWSRQNKEDDGHHESICSNGSPEEFEMLWQQTPFGEAQKKKVKGQLQAESDQENEIVPTAD